MVGYQELKAELLDKSQRLSSVLGLMDAMPGTVQHTFADWMNVCKSIENQLSEEMVRIAVIGAIKSGKSTLINSLFSGDYLKRGAGVVTAMVTKIRRGKQLRSTLFFKSWEEVNSDIERALVLFPSMEWKSNKEKFDIRREADREELRLAIGSVEKKHLISNDTRNLNSLFLSYYVKGYDRVKDYLASESLLQDYYNQDFAAHRDFSGNEVMALYLKDISLEINTGQIDENIEIADCQGSDSPNPLHMAMIQDYLIVANFLIYVISSRTGIRQADINFLSMIKKMGLIDHIVFVVNVDLNEHQAADDLKLVIEKIREDLSLVKEDPEVYAYSALLSLFRNQREIISARDKDRLLHWEREQEISLFSDNQELEFVTRFQELVTKQRQSLLLMNHLDRLKMIQTGLHQWILLKQGVLTKGVEDVSALLKKVKTQQKKVDRLKSLVKSTLDGAIGQIKRTVRTDVDRFFDSRSGEVVPSLIEFIQKYTLSLHKYQDTLSTGGFADTLYLVFQEFTHQIDLYMAEDINPRIFKFIKNLEDKIKEYFDSISGSYEALARDAFSEYNTVMATVGIGMHLEYQKKDLQLDLKMLKRENRLELPPASATMHYSVAIKTEAMARLGFYNFIMKLRQLIKRPAKNGIENAFSALKDAVSRMKKETEKSLIFHFKNYNENIKFQYVFKLIDSISEHIYTLMTERFHDYSQDLSALTNFTAAKQVDKEQLAASLKKFEAEVSSISDQLLKFQIKLNQLSQPE